MSYFQKTWDNVLDYEKRAALLSYYFTTDITVKKHCVQTWKELPHGFKTFILKNLAKQMELVK